MKDERIKDIKKRFKNEWLLIKVDEFNPSPTAVIRGHLIAHSHNREEVYQKSISYKGLALIDYSEDKLPKGYAIAFLF